MQWLNAPADLLNTPKRLACCDETKRNVFLSSLKQPWDLPRQDLLALAWDPWGHCPPLVAAQWLGDLPRSQHASPASLPVHR